MASIKENYNKSGQLISYRVRVCVGRDDFGRQITKTRTIQRPANLSKTREQKAVLRLAMDWEEEERNRYAQHRTRKDRYRITFAEFVQEHWFKDAVADGNHTPSIVAFYRHTAEILLQYFGPNKKLGQIRAEDIKRYINWMRIEAKTKSGTPYSATSIQHYFATLRSILRYAERMDYLDDEPTRKLSMQEKPHRKKITVNYLDSEQAKKFLKCLESEPLYWQCLMNLLITTGLRRGEVVGLQWADLDEREKALTVKRCITIDKDSSTHIHIGATKTGESRIVPVLDRLYVLLQMYKTEQAHAYGTLTPNAYIFNKPGDAYSPLYPSQPTKWQARFVKENGLPNVSPHDLRHTAATLAMEAGASLKEVQTLLGHRDPSTTMAFYLGVSMKAQRRTVEGIERLILT